jgi:hypothetical protein
MAKRGKAHFWFEIYPSVHKELLPVMPQFTGILCSEFICVLDSCSAFCSYAGLGCSNSENHENSWFATDVAGSTVR